MRRFTEAAPEGASEIRFGGVDQSAEIFDVNLARQLFVDESRDAPLLPRSECSRARVAAGRDAPVGFHLDKGGCPCNECLCRLAVPADFPLRRLQQQDDTACQFENRGLPLAFGRGHQSTTF